MIDRNLGGKRLRGGGEIRRHHVDGDGRDGPQHGRQRVADRERDQRHQRPDTAASLDDLELLRVNGVKWF